MNRVARSRMVLVSMIGALGAYVVLHSPLRDVIAARLGLSSRVCYFVCASPAIGALAESLSAWICILAALGAARVVLDRLDLAPFERASGYGLLALGFVAVPAATLGGLAAVTGVPILRPQVGPLLSAIPALAVLAAGVRRGWRPRRIRLTGPRSGLVAFVLVLAAGLTLATVALSLAHPPTGYDALGYHAPMAVFLWQDGNIASYVDRTGPLAMPGTVQLWFGLLLLAGGERLADLGQLPFALLAAAAVFAFTRRLRLGVGAAQLAAAALLLAPSILIQAGIQVADLAGAGLLMATMALASAPARTWTGRRFALLGLGMGLIVTTKLALLPSVAGLGLVVSGAAIRQSRRQLTGRAALRRLASAVAMVLIVGAPWWTRNLVHYGNPIYPAGLPLIGRGSAMTQELGGKLDHDFVPAAALWPLYPLFERHSERSGLGPLFLLGVVVGTLVALRRARRPPLVVYAVVGAITVVAWWTLTNHDPRFLLGLFGLGFAFLPFALLGVPRRRRRAAGLLLGAAAAFSVAVTVDQAVLPLSRQPTARWEFYDRVWGVDSVAAGLPEQEGLLLHTGFANYSYAAYYPFLGLSHRRVVLPVDVEIGTDSIVARMRRTGVRYAYVTTLPASRGVIEAMYDPARFELVHLSVVEAGWRSGTRRYLYRLKEQVTPGLPPPRTNTPPRPPT
jgi:hypothetical protein